MRNLCQVSLCVGLLGLGMTLGDGCSRDDNVQVPVANTPGTAAAPETTKKVEMTDLVVGTGALAEPGDHVLVNYIGTLDNGMKFDSSFDRNEPLPFTLGRREVIKGWDQGVAGMKVGGKRRLVIPPELGYGKEGMGKVIPPNATLHFDVELISVSR